VALHYRSLAARVRELANLPIVQRSVAGNSGRLGGPAKIVDPALE